MESSYSLTDKKSKEVVETFKEWQEIHDWAFECVNNDLYDVFYGLEKFERRGYSDHVEWFNDQSFDDTVIIMYDIGYDFFKNS